MDWKVVLKYAGILFLATFIVGFIFGLLRAVLKLNPMPVWFVAAWAFSMLSAIVTPFAFLCKNQKEKPFLYVIATALLVWGLSFLSNVLLLKQPVAKWARGGIYIFIAAIIGYEIGLLLKIKSSGKDSLSQS